MEDEGLGSSFLFLVNDDGEYFCITEVEEEFGEGVSLELGENPNYDISDLIDELSEFSPSKKICAYDPIADITYTIEGGWDFDDDGEVFMEIHESHYSCKSVTAKEEYGKTDTSKYVSLYDENGLFDKLKKYANLLGTKVVYLALWLYEAAKSTSLASSTVILGALGYLMCPVDLIADFLPIIGFSDDAAILLAAYTAIVKLLSSEQIENISSKAKEFLRKYFKDFNEDDITID